LLNSLSINPCFNDFQIWFRHFTSVFDVHEVTDQITETSKLNTTCIRLAVELGNFILNTKIIDYMCLRNRIWRKFKILYLFIDTFCLPVDCISYIILTSLEFRKQIRLDHAYTHKTYNTLSGTTMNIPCSFSKLGPENRSW